MKLIKGATHGDRAVVRIDTFDDLLKPEQRIDPPDIHRGVLKNCKTAREIVPVWLEDLGYADCSVVWLRDRGCPRNRLAGKRLNDRIRGIDNFKICSSMDLRNERIIKIMSEFTSAVRKLASYPVPWKKPLLSKKDTTNYEAMELLRKTAIQLDSWANESLAGGWSTHQVEPMRKKAAEIWAFLGKNC